MHDHSDTCRSDRGQTDRGQTDRWHADTWAVVLAAGDGTRLHELTVDAAGAVVPKQFCSLRGGRSLLVDAIGRARRFARRDRVVVVVAAEHERWWRQQLECVDPANIVVQPKNRGTAAGLLLPVDHVLRRDPAARVVVVPSDHFVDRPAVLTESVSTALRALRREPDALVLLGIAPDAADTEYGWIMPGGMSPGGLRAVDGFVEKPGPARAAMLLRAGAVWNSFLLAARAAALRTLCERHVADVAAALAGPVRTGAALAAVYAGMRAADFSREVLTPAAPALRLVAVPECGWTDLGTPARVAECLRRLERGPARPRRAPWFPTVDLAEACQRACVAATHTA